MLRVVLFWSVFLLMLQNYKEKIVLSHRLAAFHSQRQWIRIFISLTIPMAMGTQLRFKQHWDSHYSSQHSRKLRFRHFYLWLFLQVALYHTPHLRVLEVHINGIRGISIHITETKIHISYSENHDSTLLFYYFYMSPHFKPLPYHCWR